MLLKSNPFISALLNNISLEFYNISDDFLVVVSNNYISDSIKSLFETVISKSYNDVIKKYKLFNFPNSIEIIDENKNNILTIKPNKQTIYDFKSNSNFLFF